MSLVKVVHVVTPDEEATLSLFMKIVACVKMTYPDVETEAEAILALKNEYSSFLSKLTSIAFILGKKMANADSKDDTMYMS